MNPSETYPNLTAVVAIDQNRGIGKNNQLMWYMPADLAHFKQLTLNHTILMGRKTYAAIGKPLPHRQNVVLTRDHAFQAEGISVIHDLQNALTLANSLTQPLMIIGGAEIYTLFMPYLSCIELTIIEHTFDADTFFPALAKEAWQEVSRIDHQADEKNKYAYSFLTLKRINKPR